MKIRKVALDDAKAICNIYNYYVINTAVTFETNSVSEDEMKQRIEKLLDENFPYYVGEIDGEVIGYCYVNKWNNRCAYSSTQEVTIYLHKDEEGKGFATTLYDHLLKNIDRKTVHALIAGISIPNEGSVRLHQKFGFKQASNLIEIGRKFDQWWDVQHWQLIFNQPRILILCTGNSCRSQMAHGFLQSFDPLLTVCSAGTKASGKLNPKAVEVMKDGGIDISHHTSDSVEKYLDEEWDYVITVCGGANESCPTFVGKVKNRLHIGFDDPSDAEGTPKFIQSEFIRVRDQIKEAFYELYTTKIKTS